jgi:hypothetical protein
LPWDEKKDIVDLVEQDIRSDPYVIMDSGSIVFRKIKKSWPKIDLKISTFFQETEPTLDDLILYLEGLYPLPESVTLTPDQATVRESAITHGLANLTIPDENHNSIGSSPTAIEQDPEGVLWPSSESCRIRSMTIRRLAQDLLFSSIVISKTLEPDIPSAQSSTEYFTFSHLFQKTSKDGIISNAPKITLSSTCQTVLGEWKLGGNPSDYAYQLHEAAMNDVSEFNGEVDEEEAKEREERMLQLRRKREKREERVRLGRNGGASNNVSLGGSLSQPGHILDSQGYNDSLGIADEDGLFSLPTVISASQPVSVIRSNLQSRSQSQQKPKPTASASQTTNTIRRVSTEVKKHVSNSQDTTIPESSSAVRFSFSFDQQSQSLSQEQNLSQEQSLSQDMGGGITWGASQPVRGAFATRRNLGSTPSAGQKAKKKKPRTQGF